ncbi:hypothetical protein [Caminicella sporogenes]|uniref:hypothetical protein n=1 Tax=Caminicella sporogenes TaxID=166485 RepID=UPI002F3FF6A3
MRTLAVDIETYSSVDLTRCGVYKYTESPDFEILLFGYAFDDEEVKVIDLAQGEKVPEEVMTALTNPATIKIAFNANFERTCISKHFNIPMPPNQWRCSAVHALTLGLPGNLEGVAKSLNLSQQKMKEGKALIRYFSVPCKPTKANGGRTRNLPKHDIKKWNTFKDYCKRDVEVERAIRKKLENYPQADKEIRLWQLDQQINDRGVLIDKDLVDNAIKCDEIYQKKLLEEAIHLTGLENPNSPVQLKGWLENKGIKIKSLSKEKVSEILKETDNPKIKRVLKLRQEMSKTSVKKYEAMVRAMCKDKRVRGLLQFYGANRTGRWCLAAGSNVLVKTPDGIVIEKPIEDVELDDLVFDGKEWVEHEGVVYSGDKEVITWDSVTATPEHIVYISDTEYLTLGEAKERGVKLWRGNTLFTV